MNTTLQLPTKARDAAVGSEIHDHFLVSGTDIFALGHYPGNPIYPGVLIAERLCRLAETLLHGETGEVMSVDAIKRIQYLDAVLPGDRVELSASLRTITESGMEISATARVGDKLKARATLRCIARGKAVADGVEAQRSDPGGKAGRAMSHRQIASVLPHRYPFLLLDTIEDYEPGAWIRARKVVNRASPLFLEQPPPWYPQGLIIESIGQAGIALFFMSRDASEPQDIVLGSVGDTTLQHHVPFDVALTIEARIDRMLQNGVVFSGEARIGNQIVTRVGSLVAMIDPR